MWTFGLENETNRYGEVTGIYDLPIHWDIINTMPTWGVGLVALGIVLTATTMKLEQGEAVVLQNSITGKRKGVVKAEDRTKRFFKSPFTSARRYVSEAFNTETGQFSQGKSANRVTIRERLFEMPSSTATTKDGVEVDYVLSAVLKVVDPQKFISISEDPMGTVMRNLVRKATPLFKQNSLDEVRSDRSEMEEQAISDVKELAEKYGIEIVGVSTSEPVLNPEYAKELSLKAAAELRSMAAETSGTALATKIKAVADGLGLDNREVAMLIAERTVAVEMAANSGGSAVVTMPTIDFNPVKSAEALARGEVGGSKEPVNDSGANKAKFMHRAL